MLRRHFPPAPTVSDGGSDELGILGAEFAGDLGAFAFAVHVDAAGVDGVGLTSPGDHLADGFVVGVAELLGLGMDAKQNIVFTEALTAQGFANGINFVAGGAVVFGETEDEADLLGGVSGASGGDGARGFDGVADGGAAEFKFGFGGGTEQ